MNSSPATYLEHVEDFLLLGHVLQIRLNAHVSQVVIDATAGSGILKLYCIY